MSWRVLARKEAGDAVRDRTLHANAGLLGLFGAALGYGYARITASPGTAGYALADNTTLLAMVVVPLVSLVTTYSTVNGERSAGRLRLTLTLGHARRDVVVGTFLGRAAANVAAALAGLGAALLVALAFGASVDLLPYLGFVLATAGLAVALSAVGVALSATLASTTLALVGGLAFYGFSVVSDGLLRFLYAWLSGSSGPAPAWLRFLARADPVSAFWDTAQVLTGGPAAGPLVTAAWLGPPLLAAWVLLPLAVGDWRLEAVDL